MIKPAQTTIRQHPGPAQFSLSTSSQAKNRRELFSASFNNKLPLPGFSWGINHLSLQKDLHCTSLKDSHDSSFFYHSTTLFIELGAERKKSWKSEDREENFVQLCAASREKSEPPRDFIDGDQYVHYEGYLTGQTGQSSPFSERSTRTSVELLSWAEPIMFWITFYHF